MGYGLEQLLAGPAHAPPPSAPPIYIPGFQSDLVRLLRTFVPTALLGSRKGRGNSYQEEVKHNHPAPTSIQGFSVGSGLSLPLQHDTLSVLNVKVPVVNPRHS